MTCWPKTKVIHFVHYFCLRWTLYHTVSLTSKQPLSQLYSYRQKLFLKLISSTLETRGLLIAFEKGVSFQALAKCSRRGRELDVSLGKKIFCWELKFHLSPFLDFFISTNDKMIYQNHNIPFFTSDPQYLLEPHFSTLVQITNVLSKNS